MAINFGLQESNRGNYLEALQAFDYGRQSRIKEVEQQRQQAEFARKEQARMLIGNRASVADVQAVDPQSAYDYSQHLSSVHKDEVAAQLQHSKTLASVGQALRTAPAGLARQMILQQAAPMLQAAGIGPEQLGQIDVNNDGQLDGLIAANNAFIGQAESIVVGRALVAKDSGRVLYRDPEPTQYIKYNDGGSETVIGVQPGGGDQSSSGGAIPFDNLIQQESKGNHFASNGRVTTSPKGALGIAQIMPGTASEAARLAGLPYDPSRLRSDPEYNRALGEAYYNEQRRTFGRDDLAAAAYNAGPGAVQRALRRGGADNYLKFLPAETQEYVRKVSGGGATSAGARVVAQGTPKPVGLQPKRMTPQEVAAEGLASGTVYYRGADGVPRPVGGQRVPKSALTEGQAKATGLLEAATQAALVLNQLKDANPSEVARALSSGGLASPFSRGISQTDRRALNAQLAFSNAILRLETGATISPDETVKKARTLFPAPGDGPEVLADKRAQREAAIRGLQAAAGPGGQGVGFNGRGDKPKAIPPAVAAALAKYGAR
jgi:Transglycosylase SLT domain